MKHKSNLRRQRRQSQKPSESCQSAACTAVLALPELLECIFAYFSERDLLVSIQRVCKLWHDMIARSGRLFFTPNWTASGRRQKQNPLLVSSFGLFFDNWMYPEGPEESRPYWRYWFGPKEFMGQDLPIANMKNGRKRHNAFVRRDASWRRMLVSQPALTSFKYEESRYSSTRGHSSSRTTIETPEGLRMGHLYDLVFHILWDNNEGYNVSVIWTMAGDDDTEHAALNRVVKRPKRGRLQLIVRASYGENQWGPRYSRYYTDDDWVRDRRDRYMRTRERQSQAWMFRCEGYDGVKLVEDLKRGSLETEVSGT